MSPGKSFLCSKLTFMGYPAVGLQHLENVFPVVLLAHEKEPLHVLGLAARLQDVLAGILLDEVYGVIKGCEILVKYYRDARVLELLLAERPVILEPVAVRRSPYHVVAALPELLRLLPVPQDVVENYHVRPVGFPPPALGLRDETVPYVPVRGGLYEILNVVPFLDDLPGYVAYQGVNGNKKKIFRFHQLLSVLVI